MYEDVTIQQLDEEIAELRRYIAREQKRLDFKIRLREKLKNMEDDRK